MLSGKNCQLLEDDSPGFYNLAKHDISQKNSLRTNKIGFLQNQHFKTDKPFQTTEANAQNS